jgi:hypothetical protein
MLFLGGGGWLLALDTNKVYLLAYDLWLGCYRLLQEAADARLPSLGTWRTVLACG